MRKGAILLTLCFIFCSCSVNEKPEFLGVDNIKFIEGNADFIKLSAMANFLNPNDVGGSLSADNIKVFINDMETVTLNSEDFKIPAQNLFSVPLEVDIPTDSIFNRKSMTGLIGSLLSEKVKVQYKGNIKFRVLGFSHTYLVDRTEDVKIKL